MANEENKPQENDQDPRFGLQRCYLKDLSLEMPHAPEIFLEQTPPEVEVSLTLGAKKIEEDYFESSVRATITTKVNDKVVYLCEGTQAGIFEIANIPEEQLDHLLGIVCPSMLFPYLRANLADAITRASFPPVHLAEVNFQALFEQRHAAAAQEQAKANEEKK